MPRAPRFQGSISMSKTATKISRVVWLVLATCCLGNAFHCTVTHSARVSTRCRRRYERTRQAFVSVSEENDSTATETNESPERRVCIVMSGGSDVDLSLVDAELSNKLNLPVIVSRDDLAATSETYSHALVVVPYTFESITSHAVAIQELDNPSNLKRSSRRRRSAKPKSKPFFIDFMPPTNSRLGKRFQGQSGSDLLTKAVSANNKTVYDLTAGFGQDSLLMVQGGALRVTMVERDPIVAALLQDGLRRLNLIASKGYNTDPRTLRARELSEKLTFLDTADAVQVANSIIQDPLLSKPDVCYLDPMFPSRRKSAAVKKNMQILHGLLGSQSNKIATNEATRREEQEFLEAAWNLARERVVVKRPIGADHLGATDNSQDIKPSYEIKGSVNRWDVYVK